MERAPPPRANRHLVPYIHRSDVNDLLRRNGISSGRGTGQTLSINSFRALCHKATGNVLMENMSHIEAFLKVCDES